MLPINSLTQERIINEKLPINELLTNSLYYPSCGFDGGVVKYFSEEIQTFIYCDYAADQENLLQQINTFTGYHIMGQRNVKKHELVPNNWNPVIPPNVDKSDYLKYQDSFKTPFAHWVVYERDEDRIASYGAKRFSLLYIGGEGVATYQALYWSNHSFAKAIAIIQPGTGFGLNWTDFRRQDSPFGWVVLNNQYGVPDTIIYGGYGNNYGNLNWNGYKKNKTIQPYYSGRETNEDPFGEITVWKKKD